MAFNSVLLVNSQIALIMLSAVLCMFFFMSHFYHWHFKRIFIKGICELYLLRKFLLLHNSHSYSQHCNIHTSFVMKTMDPRHCLILLCIQHHWYGQCSPQQDTATDTLVHKWRIMTSHYETYSAIFQKAVHWYVHFYLFLLYLYFLYS